MQGWGEMLRRIKPAKIICYGKPFPEMKGNIIEIDYAKTNNLGKNFITKFFIEDEYGVKGMGSASGINTPNWTPKKPEDEKFLGKPGEIKETFNQHGERYLTKIGKNGYATKERHYSYHYNPNSHSNPHDHNIDWSGNHPNLGPPINYVEEIPEFKKYEGETMNSNIIMHNIDYFESVDDFKYAMLHGREAVFEWNGIEYGAFFEGEGDKSFFICEAYKDEKGMHFKSIDELLDFEVQGQSLKDIITRVNVIHRNV